MLEKWLYTLKTGCRDTMSQVCNVGKVAGHCKNWVQKYTESLSENIALQIRVLCIWPPQDYITFLTWSIYVYTWRDIVSIVSVHFFE